MRQNKRMNASRNRPGWLASLGNVYSRPRYPKRSPKRLHFQTFCLLRQLRLEWLERRKEWTFTPTQFAT